MPDATQADRQARNRGYVPAVKSRGLGLVQTILIRIPWQGSFDVFCDRLGNSVALPKLCKNVRKVEPNGAADFYIGQVTGAHPDFNRARGDLEIIRDLLFRQQAFPRIIFANLLDHVGILRRGHRYGETLPNSKPSSENLCEK